MKSLLTLCHLSKENRRFQSKASPEFDVERKALMGIKHYERKAYFSASLEVTATAVSKKQFICELHAGTVCTYFFCI
jgi:hypothetical protein